MRAGLIPERFWNKVHKTNSCWLWTGKRFPNGYGQVTVYGRGLLTHRVSWQLSNGPIPNGILVLHRCDVRACVRPDHLFLGTHRDNALDMFGKGRGSPPPRNNVSGERNGNAKLTAEQVKHIRALYKTGTMTQKAIAKQFGVVRTVVSRIVNRRVWTSVE